MKPLAAALAAAVVFAGGAWASHRTASAPPTNAQLAKRVAALEKKVKWMHVAIVDLRTSTANHDDAVAIDCLANSWSKIRGYPAAAFALNPTGSALDRDVVVLTFPTDSFATSTCAPVFIGGRGASQPLTTTTATNPTP